MNLDQIQHKLIAAARVHRPSEQVPFGFEQRIMARVRALQVPDEWTLWARALWNAAAPCVVIMILMSAWSLFTPATPPANPNPPAPADLTQALENTLLAAVDQPMPSLESPSPESLW
jgi:hypothetical protein